MQGQGEEARLWHGRGLALPLGLQASRGLPKGSPGPRRRPTGWGTGVVFLTKAGGESQALPVAGQGARVGHSAAAACAGPEGSVGGSSGGDCVRGLRLVVDPV